MICVDASLIGNYCCTAEMLLEYEVISTDAGECQRISYKTVCSSSWIPEKWFLWGR